MFFLSILVKFFFLFTPFFALSMFLSMTQGYSERNRHILALKISLAAAVLCIALFFFGNQVFALFGITVDAFRVGAGALLLLSAVGLVQSKAAPPQDDNEDIAVVPLAMPIIVGPATTGTLLVLGSEIADTAQKGLGAVALLTAVSCLGLILLLGSYIERALGRKGLNILSKITGLILSALAAQMILTGVRNFLFLK